MIRHLLTFLIHLGALGPLFMGILDSSFLFLPFGNDLLVVILTAQHHERLLLYVLTASLGSTAGVLLLDLVCRKGGEEGLKRVMNHKRLVYFKKKMAENSILTLAVACVAPPPFPFTVVVAASSAFQYPRVRLLSVVLIGRAARFLLLGLIAIWLGRHILEIVKSTGFEWFMGVFMAICLVGSTLAVLKWTRRS